MIKDKAEGKERKERKSGKKSGKKEMDRKEIKVKMEIKKSREPEKAEKEVEIKKEGELPLEETEEIVEMPFSVEKWQPKTGLGMKVRSGEITDIDYILDRGHKILEPEIVDMLLPNLKTEFVMIGQAKGKFGGGQRRIFKQTQKKTPEGNKPHFATFAVVGNSDGYVGVGYGKAKETVPAREKAIRNAKLSIIKIRRGCGSWQCGCANPHSIPFAVSGRCSSVRIKLIPAPKGKGLCITKECQKILELAGIKDIWSKTLGQTRSTINLVNACMAALTQLTKMKIRDIDEKSVRLIEGKIGIAEAEAEIDKAIAEDPQKDIEKNSGNISGIEDVEKSSERIRSTKK